MQTWGSEMGQSARDYHLNCHGDVGEFIDRLIELRADDWISAVPDLSPGSIEDLIRKSDHQVAAWSIVDEVETAAHVVFASFTRDARSVARRKAAIFAAERAALALLLRPELSAKEFERLYRPFRELIPLGD